MANLDLKSPGVQKLLLAILLSGGALGAYFFSHLMPWTFPKGSEHIAELKSQYEQKSAELARARASVADLPRFEAEYEQLHQRWELASELLPTDRQLPTLLRKITLAGQQTGVTFTMFRPAGMKPSDYHTEMPINVSVSGDYHSVGSFLAELSNMRRIVTVSNLKLVTNAKSDGAGSTQAEFTASAYSLNTAPAPAAAASTDPKKG
ncbi:MAG: type 4a pilus biogenesis protein PilO, partial [Candidatus Eisenbacteria bacterium]